MTKRHTLLIQKTIEEIDLIIEKFLIDINAGEVGDLNKLDKKINKINIAILKLTEDEFLDFKIQFEETLRKVKELKEFLSHQLESTATKIKLIDKSSIVSKHYNYAANDNV